MPATIDATDKVVLFRDEGLSFAAIASMLNLERPSDACDLFITAVEAMPAPARHAARRREQARLVDLASAIAARPNLEPAARARLLAALEGFRMRVGGLSAAPSR